MSRWTPCKRRDFIKKLRQLGFDGPFSGTRHQFMVFDENRLTIPSNDEYSVAQLRMMIRLRKLLIAPSLSMSGSLYSCRWRSAELCPKCRSLFALQKAIATLASPRQKNRVHVTILPG